MPVFAFEAMDNKGQKVRKEIEGANRDDAIAKAKGLGLHPTKISEKAGAVAEKSQRAPAGGGGTSGTTPSGRTAGAPAASGPGAAAGKSMRAAAAKAAAAPAPTVAAAAPRRSLVFGG